MRDDTRAPPYTCLDVAPCSCFTLVFAGTFNAYATAWLGLKRWSLACTATPLLRHSLWRSNALLSTIATPQQTRHVGAHHARRHRHPLPTTSAPAHTTALAPSPTLLRLVLCAGEALPRQSGIVGKLSRHRPAAQVLHRRCGRRAGGPRWLMSSPACRAHCLPRRGLTVS